MKSYKVSILVPVYGVEKFIRHCAGSLFSQTIADDIEFIFINDCTTDNSLLRLNEIIAEYPRLHGNIRIISHEMNKGVGAARQSGLEQASGDYILFVDGDDYIESDMVEILYNKSLERESDIIFCSYYNEYHSNRQSVFHVSATDNKRELLIQSINQPSLWNKMFKRTILTKNNLRFPDGINYGEDLSFVPRLIFYSDSFSFVDKPLYHYVRYNNTSYTREFSDINLDQTIRVIGILSDFFADKADYTDLTNYLKAVRKAKILRSGRLEKQYINLFPEINSTLDTLKSDYKTKLILTLAAKRQKLLLKVFVKALLFKGKL